MRRRLTRSNRLSDGEGSEKVYMKGSQSTSTAAGDDGEPSNQSAIPRIKGKQKNNLSGAKKKQKKIKKIRKN